MTQIFLTFKIKIKSFNETNRVLHRLASICLAALVTHPSSHFQTPDSLASFRPRTRCLDAFSHSRPVSFSSAYVPVRWGSAILRLDLRAWGARSAVVSGLLRRELGRPWCAGCVRGNRLAASDELEPAAVAGNSLPQFPSENGGHTSARFQAVTQSLVI